MMDGKIHNIETLLYGCEVGKPDYMEEILYACKGYVNKDEILTKGKEWAKANNYDRLRISVVDLSTPPDFTKTISE
jgi:hypothetical protein